MSERQAKLGDTIRCKRPMSEYAGQWAGQQLTATLDTQEAVDFANNELLPSGRWKVIEAAEV